MAKMLRVLMIESDLSDAWLMKSKLAQINALDAFVFEVEWVDTLTEGLAYLGNGASLGGMGIDVVLTDLDLTDSERTETLSRLRTQAPQVPIVVLGGEENEALALQCVREGAQDYLCKDLVTDAWLAHALCHAVERQRVQAQVMALRPQGGPLVTRNPEMLELSGKNTRILIEDSSDGHGISEGLDQPIAQDVFHAVASLSCPYIVQDGRCRADEVQDFVRVVSHDLRTPLRIVKRYTERLGEACAGQRTDEIQRSVHFVVEGVTRMEQMLEGLVAYARTEHSGDTLVLTDIESILEHVLQTLHFEIVEREAVVTHDPLPSLLVDAVQLEQVFQNLIDNALKYQPARSESRSHQPRIHITAQVQGSDWRFAVQDNGIGIAPEDHPRVFEIFDRLHTQEEYPGTGMGLAICKRIVERHGGQMGVESESGNGATFYFTLPRLRQVE